jgi:hypothetical protein
MSHPDTTATDAPAAQAAPQRKRRRLGCQLALLIFITVLALGGGWAYWKWNQVPAYWTDTHQEMAQYSKQEIVAMSQSLQARFSNAFNPAPGTLHDSAAGGSAASSGTGSAMTGGSSGIGATASDGKPDVRDIPMTSIEINAWLREELPKWLAFKGKSLPQGVSDITFATEGQRLVLGMRVKTAEIEQVVTLMARVETNPDKGSACIQDVSMRGGDLPIPADAINQHFGKDLAAKYAQEFKEVQEILAGASFEPIINIQDDQRQGRLVGITVRPDGITTHVRIEPKRKK